MMTNGSRQLGNTVGKKERCGYVFNMYVLETFFPWYWTSELSLLHYKQPCWALAIAFSAHLQRIKLYLLLYVLLSLARGVLGSQRPPDLRSLLGQQSYSWALETQMQATKGTVPANQHGRAMMRPCRNPASFG